MRKQLIIAWVLFCMLSLTGCFSMPNSSSAVQSENSNTFTHDINEQLLIPEKFDRTVIEIRDIVEEENIPCDMAFEKFYEDENNEYYFSVIKSQYVIVTYDDGSSEDLITALEDGKITMLDLDQFGIVYDVIPKKTNYIHFLEGNSDIQK